MSMSAVKAQKILSNKMNVLEGQIEKTKSSLLETIEKLTENKAKQELGMLIEWLDQTISLVSDAKKLIDVEQLVKQDISAIQEIEKTLDSAFLVLKEEFNESMHTGLDTSIVDSLQASLQQIANKKDDVANSIAKVSDHVGSFIDDRKVSALADKISSDQTKFFDAMPKFANGTKIDYDVKTKKLNIEKIIRDLEKSTSELQHSHEELQTPKRKIDERFLDDSIVLLRGISDVHENVKNLKEKLIDFKSEDKTNEVMLDYISSVKELSDGVREKINHLKTKDGSNKYLKKFLEVSHKLDDIFSKGTEALKEVMDEKTDYDSLTDDAKKKIQELDRLIEKIPEEIEANTKLLQFSELDEINFSHEAFKNQLKYIKQGGMLDDEVKNDLSKIGVSSKLYSDVFMIPNTNIMNEKFYANNLDMSRTLYETDNSLKEHMHEFDELFNNGIVSDESLSKIVEGMGGTLLKASEQQIGLINQFNVINNFNQSDIKVLDIYDKNLDKLINNYSIIINQLERVNVDSPYLKQFKEIRKKLADSKERINDIKTASKSFVDTMKDFFSSSKTFFAMVAGSTAMMMGGNSILDLITKAPSDVINRMQQLGLANYNLSRTDIAHGAPINRESNDALSYRASQAYYDLTYGSMDFPFVQNLYMNLYNNVGGNRFNTISQNQADMRYMATQLAADKELFGVSDASITKFVTSFYRDLGLSAEDTVKHFRKMEMMAIQNNVSVDTLADIIAPLAKNYREMGFSEMRVTGIMGSFSETTNLLIQDIGSIIASTGKAASGWQATSSKNWGKNMFFGMLTGESSAADAVTSALIPIDRFGNINNEYYDKMVDRIFAQATMFGEINDNVGQMTFVDRLRENGYSEKDSVELLGIAQTQGIDALKEKLKSIDQAKDPNAPIASMENYVAALGTAANELSEVQKLEAKYMSSINRIAHMLHVNFNDSLSDIVKKLTEKVEEFYNKMSELISKFLESKLGKKAWEFFENHPVASLLMLYTGGRIAKYVGTKLLKNLASLPMKLLTSAPATNAEKSLVTNVISHLDGLGRGQKTMLLAAIFAGATTLQDVIAEHSAKSEEQKLDEFLRSGDAKVQLVDKDKNRLIGGAAALALAAVTGYSLFKGRGKLGGLKNMFSRNAGKMGKLSKAQRRREAMARAGKLVERTTWRSAGKNFGTNLLMNVAFEGFFGDGDMDLSEIGKDTLIMSGSELAGEIGMGALATVLATKFHVKNPAQFINTFRRGGAFVGSMAPFALDYLSPSVAEASPLEMEGQDSSQRQMLANYYQTYLNQNMALNRNFGIMDERSAQNFGSMSPLSEDEELLRNHEDKKESLFVQSNTFGEAAMALGLSNREFSSLVSISLANHGMDWRKMNDDQQRLWLDKYKEFKKMYDDDQAAMFLASRSLKNNPFNTPELRKKIREALTKEWEDNTVKANWFAKKAQGLSGEDKDKYEMLANYYYHMDENPEDEDGFWFKQANNYHEMVKNYEIGNIAKILGEVYNGEALQVISASELKKAYSMLALSLKDQGELNDYIAANTEAKMKAMMGGFSLGGSSAGIEGVDAFMRAIMGQESGGDYDLINSDSGASGAFQIMPENWPYWAEAAGLGSGAPMTPENQNYVARYKMLEYYRKFGNWRDVAIAWYGGEGAVSYSEEEKSRVQSWDGTEYPSINEYADSVMRRMGVAGSGSLSGGSSGGGGATSYFSIDNGVLTGGNDLLEQGYQRYAGVTMDNGTVGCVEAATKIGAYYNSFLKEELDKGVVGVEQLANDANARGLLQVYNGSNVQRGDVLVYMTDDGSDYQHVNIADGAGGIYGNSSGRNMVVHDDEYYKDPTYVIKTGGGSSMYSPGQMLNLPQGKPKDDRPLQEQVNDMSKIAEYASGGKVTYGGLTDNMNVDPTQSYQSVDEKRKEIMGNMGMSETEIKARMDNVMEKLSSVSELLKTEPKLTEKPKDKSTLVKIIQEIAEEFMDDVEIVSDSAIA